MSQDKLATVRKLLAMAEADGLTDEARETYNTKARELIAQYGVPVRNVSPAANGDDLAGLRLGGFELVVGPAGGAEFS